MEEKKLSKAIRVAFRDVAFKYRMGAGFAGDVNRTHPHSVEPALINVATPPTAYGQFVIATATNDVRPFAAGDTAVTNPYGMTVRPFPTQQTTGGMSATLGAATPPVTGVIDILRSGMIMAVLNTGSAASAKGAAVFIWVAATVAGHVQGQLEAAANGGNTAALDATLVQFNGPADASGIVEVSLNVGA
jgi:hypothetical protein